MVEMQGINPGGSWQCLLILFIGSNNVYFQTLFFFKIKKNMEDKYRIVIYFILILKPCGDAGYGSSLYLYVKVNN